jgi:hypothetical protein
MDDTETGQGPQDTSTTIASSGRRGTMYQRAEWRHDHEPAIDGVTQPASNEQVPAGFPPEAIQGAVDADQPAGPFQTVAAVSPRPAAQFSPANAPAYAHKPPPAVVRPPAPRPTPARARRLTSNRHRRASLALPAIVFAAAVLIIVRLLWPSSATAPPASAATTSSAAAPADRAIETRSQPQPAAVSGQPGAAVPQQLPGVSEAAADDPPPASAARPEAPPARRSPTPPPTTTTASPAPPARAVAAATLAAAQPATAPRASAGQIRVTSEPAGARVTVNGIGWGQTPVTIRNLTLGPHTLRLTSDGYRSVQRTVQVTGDQPSATVRVTLRPAGKS